jgi:Predicted transcriptional regulators
VEAESSRAKRARGVYSIAVASELVGVGVQTLRLYESRGLLAPSRTAGGTRRYSDDDVELLRRVVALLDEGINLAGVRRILQLEAMNSALRREIVQISSV